MVKHLQIFILLPFFLGFIEFDIIAQNSKIDTTSISIEVILSTDTIQINDTLEVSVKFCNNQVFPTHLLLGNNLRLSYESGFSDYLDFIDKNLNSQIIELQGYECFELNLSVIASDYMNWYGENKFRVFYFAFYNKTRYFSFSQPLIVFYKY